MTATIAPPTFAAPAPRFDGFMMHGITWRTYVRLRDELDEARQNVRITYDRGRMALMSPRPDHEKWKTLLGSLLSVLAMERNIPVSCLGSTTWRRRGKRRGLEADQCYYVQHEAHVRGRLNIDLRRDPPPDLAIEIEVTHHPIDRLSIYAALGVPEVWRFNGRRLTTLHLAEARKYTPAEFSLAFPFLRPSELERFVAMSPASDDTTILVAFRDWVRTLKGQD
jgi:Uma2 family endonuclease